MRIVAVSATLPNIVDIASFLDAHEAYLFDSSFRPVPLTTHVIGLGQAGKNQFLFDKNLNRHVPDLVKRFSDGRPTIIFCHTKKTTEALASELTSSIGRGGDSNLSKMASQTNHTSLKHCLLKGIAFHHAGLEHENRKLVENSFSKGLIKCLCATSTLAMGVNLPARLVVIKGTSVWRGAGQGYQDIDSGMLLQMMGRAGRPGLDDCGTSVIMTDTSSKYRYERMTHGLRPVESMLPKQLTETLNSEISQKVITNTKEAIDWLKGTFFFIRVKKNAKYYGLQGRDNNELESYLMSQCVVSLQKLHEANIIDLDTEGNNIVARPASHVMSRQIISFDGMKAIVELPHDSGPLQILNAISSMEGTHFPVRRNEKVRRKCFRD
jgi:ATP-dependent DNA helicase HFM1/MER3